MWKFYLSAISSRRCCTWNILCDGPKRTPARWVRCQAHCCCFILGAGCESAASDQASLAVYLYWLRFYFPRLWLINREPSARGRNRNWWASCLPSRGFPKGIRGGSFSLDQSLWAARAHQRVYRVLIWEFIFRDAACSKVRDWENGSSLLLAREQGAFLRHLGCVRDFRVNFACRYSKNPTPLNLYCAV